MVEAPLPAALIAFLTWLIPWLIQKLLGQAGVAWPPEFGRAARAIEANADKWGNVADALLTWHWPAAFVLGAVIMFFLVRRNDR